MLGGQHSKGHNIRKVEEHWSSLSLRDLEMRSRWVRVVPKPNGTCYNKTRDERRSIPGKKGWIRAEAKVMLTEPSGLQTHSPSCWIRCEQVFPELSMSQCHSILMLACRSVLVGG